jgi:hypothetical protein
MAAARRTGIDRAVAIHVQRVADGTSVRRGEELSALRHHLPWVLLLETDCLPRGGAPRAVGIHVRRLVHRRLFPVKTVVVVIYRPHDRGASAFIRHAEH